MNGEKTGKLDSKKKKTVYDHYSNTLNFEKRRVTDIATCRRVYPPPPLPTDMTIVLKNMTDRILSTTREYIKTACDRKGIPKVQNISGEEEEGLQSLEKRVSRGEVVIMPTDKSKKLTVSKPDNYVELMESHLRNDPM